MSFLSTDDPDRWIFALLIRDAFSEDERRALILELSRHESTPAATPRHDLPAE